MDPYRWSQIEGLFLRACESDPARRTQLLEEAPNADPELRRIVEELLASEEGAAQDLHAAVYGAVNAVAFPLVGETVSHYRVLAGIGTGGMGSVYKAEDLKLGRPVALKFLPEELAQDPVALKRLEQEARAASALNHPNVCTIYEIAEHVGRPFIVMEFLEGETLREQISQQGSESRRASLERHINLGIEVCDALAAAHTRGVIHRDIKPANIFVTRTGVAKILDFGVAKLSQSTIADDNKSPTASSTELNGPYSVGGREIDQSLTQTGVTIGTTTYMSPEQVRGEMLDARTDLFSFGLVLYEMATGRVAFGADRPALTRDAILCREPAPPSELNPGISAQLAQIIRTALEKDRDRRYQSAAQMRSDLEAEAAALHHLDNANNFKSSNVTLVRADSHSGSLLKRLTELASWRLAAVIAIPLLFASLLMLFFTGRSTNLTASDHILISDFVNTTGDPVFDGTLRQAVTVKLGESPYFNLIPESGVHKTLKLLNRANDEPLLPPLSLNVCQRAGGSALVGGSIGTDGGGYKLDVAATNCATGARVAEQEMHVSDKAQVLRQLGRGLRALRRDLGESVASLRKFDTPIEEATSKSLAALRAFTLGEEKRARGKESESLTDYRLAIELDPDFAMAYARSAAVAISLNQLDVADAYMQQAYERRQHLTEKEKLYVQARYYSDTARELENEIEAYSLWSQLYPNDFYPLNGLASALIHIGQPEEAIQAALRSMQLNPEHALPYATLARAYERAGRFEEAKAICEKAIAEKVDAFWIHTVLFRTAFVENDESGMQLALEWFVGKPQESTAIYFQAKAVLSRGQVGRSRQLFERARKLAENRGLKEQSISILNGQAQFEADMGLSGDAQVPLDSVLRDAPNGGRHMAFAVLALARYGEANRAELLLKELESHPMRGTAMNAVVLPAIQAAIALDRSEPSLAIAALQRSIPYDLGQDSGGVTSYYRGLALLQAKSWKDAVVEFQKIINNRGVVAVDIYWPLAHLGLARAFAAMGDSTAALAQYRYLLTFWGDADQSLRIFQEAKSEYRRLNSA